MNAVARGGRIAASPHEGHRAPFGPFSMNSIADSLDRVSGLDTAEGLHMMAGRPQLYRAALNTFARHYAAGLPGGPDAELTALRAQAHGISGAAGAIGARQIVALTEEIQSEIRIAGRSDRLAAIACQLDTLLARLSQDIQAALDTEQA